MATKVILPLVPKGALNKNRAVSGLLKAQILHLHEAERRLPLRHRSDIYINAIKTEGEAAEYIREVTMAIHAAHAAAAAKRGRGIAIAAAADEKPAGKASRANGKTKKGTGKRGRKT